jgi:hypothetical protein
LVYSNCLFFFGKLSPQRWGNILFSKWQNAEISPQKKLIAYHMWPWNPTLKCEKSNVICSSVKSNFFSSFGFVDSLLNCQWQRLLKIQYGLFKNLRSRNFIRLPPYGRLLIETFPSVPKAWPNFPNFFSFHSIEFSMTKWFNIK